MSNSGRREIPCEQITKAVQRLCIEAATILPPALGILLECAAESEPNAAAAAALEGIVENFKSAAAQGRPICREMGMAVVFADIGQDVHITGGLFEDAVNEGVRCANMGKNTPCIVHVRLTEGDKISLHVMLKGLESENMSAMRIFSPDANASAIEDFITETASKAGANDCLPVILGVGLGGTVEQCAIIAKRALLRPVDTRSADEYYAEMECCTLEKINQLGIGPQGLGGRFTAIAVNIEASPVHKAVLPCVVNVSCHAARNAYAKL